MPVTENVHYHATCTSFGVMLVVANVHYHATCTSFGVMPVMENDHYHKFNLHVIWCNAGCSL